MAQIFCQHGLGVQWVADRGDPALARGARDLLGKILAVLPEELRPAILQSPVVAPNTQDVTVDELDLESLRRSIRMGDKVRIHYIDLKEQSSERTLWPTTLAYFETVRLLVAWCELRGEFRHFRTDRIEKLEILDVPIPINRTELRRRWREARPEACLS